MIDKHQVVCIIPARGGSKGIPRKNIRFLAGKPLIAFTIDQALQSEYIDRTIVSTEDEEIAALSRRCGAEVPFIRPEYLAGDEIATIDVLLHSVAWLEEKDNFEFDILVLLHTTSPLRTVEDIDHCVKMLVNFKAENVFSVTEAYRNPYFNIVEIDNGGHVKLVKEGHFATRQSAPRVYDLNASIYVWWKDILKERKKVILPGSKIYLMPRERSVDIDSELDFKICQMLLAEKTPPR